MSPREKILVEIDHDSRTVTDQETDERLALGMEV